jgi:hypothetical protein
MVGEVGRLSQLPARHGTYADLGGAEAVGQPLRPGPRLGRLAAREVECGEAALAEDVAGHVRLTQE